VTVRRGLAGALLLAATLGACAVDDQRSARARDDADVPFGLLDEGAPPLVPSDPDDPADDGASLCFIDGQGLRTVVARVDAPDDLREVIDALGSPPDGPEGPLRTAIGREPPLVRDVHRVSGIAQVELTPAISALSSDEQLRAVAQLVCTLTAQPGVGPVSFTLEGSTIDVPRADGSLTSDPVSRDDYVELIDRPVR
jgi:hypothetical protein